MINGNAAIPRELLTVGEAETLALPQEPEKGAGWEQGRGNRWLGEARGSSRSGGSPSPERGSELQPLHLPQHTAGMGGGDSPCPSPAWSPSGGSSHSSRWPPLSIDPLLSQLPPYQGRSQLWAPAPAPLIFPLSRRHEVLVPQTTCLGLGPGAWHLG